MTCERKEGFPSLRDTNAQSALWATVSIKWLTEESSRRKERIIHKRLCNGLWIYQLGKGGDIANRFGRTQRDISTFLLDDGFAVIENAWRVEKYHQSGKRIVASATVSDCNKMLPLTYGTIAG